MNVHDWPLNFDPHRSGKTFTQECMEIQRKRILQQSKFTSDTVFCVRHIAVVCKRSDTDHGQPSGQCVEHFLIRGNATGMVSIFAQSGGSMGSNYFDEKPIITFQAAQHGPIYAMEWIENVDHDQQQHGMLVTGSEGEISGWNWGDVVAAIQAKRSQEHEVQSTEGIVHIEPAFTFSDFPIDIGTGRKIETNALFYDRHRNLLYSGGGDDFVNVWDLRSRSRVHRFQARHERGCYILTIKCTRDKMFVGGDDGTVQVFGLPSKDSTAPAYQHLHSLSPFTGHVIDHTAKGNTHTQEEKLKKLKHPSWVSALDISNDGNWMVCGGGAAFVTLWFLPELQITSVMPTSSNCNVAFFHDDKIVTAGSEKYVYFWNRNGSLNNRLATGLKCIFSAHIICAPGSISDGVCVVGGIGAGVHLLKHGQKVAELGCA